MSGARHGGPVDAIDLIADAVVEVDDARRVTLWNAAAERLFGYTRDEAIGRDVADLILFPEHRTPGVAGGAGATGPGEAYVVDLRNRRRDGTAVWVTASVTPRLDAAGNPVGLIAVLRDTSEHRLVEVLEADRSTVFEMILQRRPLSETLSQICRAAERQMAGVTCAILTIDERGRFSTATAPALDERYQGALVGQATADRGTPCAVAAATTAPVVVEDMEADPAWAQCRPLARLWALRSCWSTPVRGDGGEPVATFALYSPAPRLPTERDLPVIDALSHLVGVAVARDREARALLLSERRRARVHQLMVGVEQAERARIASDLHDDTVQVLTATLLSLDQLLDAPAEERRRHDLLQQARQTLRLAVDRTRLLMFDLRPQLLDAGGLQAAVPALVSRTARDGGFAADVEISPGRYPQELEAVCYRTFSEAITNVRKHAHARRVTVRLAEEGGHLHGRVADDGVGCHLHDDGGSWGGHLGIETMRERVLLAGGSFGVTSAPGAGTTIQFTLPV